MMKYDVIVVGAGSMGMAAGYYLAKDNKKVLMMDSYDPPHSNGSHHGETRIIRHAYGEGEQYVPFVLRAQELWLELEEKANAHLFMNTGVINIGDPNSPFIQEVQDSSKQHNLPLETLTAKEIYERWPGLQLPDHLIGCVETNSGVLFSERCILAYRTLAEQLGATVKTNTEVKDINIHGNFVRVITDTEVYEAASIIITAGAWSKTLLQKVNIDLPLQTIRKTFSWFQTNSEEYDASTFPAFTINLGDEMYYGFPDIEGAGVKIGRHDGGHPLNIENSTEPFGTYPEDKGDVSRIIECFFPKVDAFQVGKTCIYTNTPDEDFIIDTLPGHSNVAIACGFSGHGFKFSSVVGEVLSQMVTNQEISFDMSPFRLSRFNKEG